MIANGPSFHIHPETGEPGRCRARLHCCPYSTEDNHFGSREDARAFYEDFANRMTDPSRSVDFHFVTDEEKSSFTEGDCGILARVIHRKTGWPIVVASYAPSDSLENLDWDHMAVRTPDGRILDATGLSREDDFRKIWKAKALTEISEKQWGTVHPWKQQFDSSPIKVTNRILKALDSLGLGPEQRGAESATRG